jgi:pre-mRNA cleavage complex 2 protein Pcf11
MMPMRTLSFSFFCYIVLITLLFEQIFDSQQKDGRLVMVPALRGAMQGILDEMQQEENEMEKVSLERLAAINANLLLQIKEMAESQLRNGVGNKSSSSGGDALPSSMSSSKSTDGGMLIDDALSFLVETRGPEILNRSKTWEKLSLGENTKDARDVIASLHRLVRESTNIEKRYTQMEALEMTGALATVSVTATLLTNTLQQIKDESDKERIKSKMGSISNSGLNGMPRTLAPSYFTIDKSLFTNDGIKKLNEAVIGLLYEVGLPFVSSGDGRRFSTQLELSKHMDALFRKGQLEKSIATTQERGWYVNDTIWSGGGKAQEPGGSTENDDGDAAGPDTGDDEADPESFTVPADESRDRCVICGINFKMFFDNEDGIYKYSNSREIEVLNDEAAAKDSEQMLVHVTCWRNLGSPELLTADQIISRF